MPSLETFNLPSQYDFEAVPMALGKARIPHGSGLDEFASFDTRLPRWQLTLVFKGLREQYGSNDAGPFGGVLPDLPYLLGFFERNVCADRKPFIVTGLARGDGDTVDRLYTFVDDMLPLKKFSYRLWSGSVKFIQFGCGDYGPGQLPPDPTS